MNILVTGGNGFIGSNLVRDLITQKKVNRIINIDKDSKESLPDKFLNIKSKKYVKLKNNLSSVNFIYNTLKKYKIDTILHLAAESHVDRSIKNPSLFLKSNIDPTINLLIALSKYNSEIAMSQTKFIYFSTDEVFGSVSNFKKPFNLNSQFDPSSPYSASKASSGMIINSWRKTYKIPISIIYCCNNYGPFQNIEKLIPATIYRALNNLPILVYGNGKNIRSWIHVKDTVSAVNKILAQKDSQDYIISSKSVLTNIEVIKTIIEKLKNKKQDNKIHANIKHIDDRPGHDFAYILKKDAKLNSIGWKEKIHFSDGIEMTIKWYLQNNEQFLNKDNNMRKMKKAGFQ